MNPENPMDLKKELLQSKNWENLYWGYSTLHALLEGWCVKCMFPYIAELFDLKTFQFRYEGPRSDPRDRNDINLVYEINPSLNDSWKSQYYSTGFYSQDLLMKWLKTSTFGENPVYDPEALVIEYWSKNNLIYNKAKVEAVYKDKKYATENEDYVFHIAVSNIYKAVRGDKGAYWGDSSWKPYVLQIDGKIWETSFDGPAGNFKGHLNRVGEGGGFNYKGKRIKRLVADKFQFAGSGDLLSTGWKIGKEEFSTPLPSNYTRGK